MSLPVPLLLEIGEVGSWKIMAGVDAEGYNLHFAFMRKGDCLGRDDGEINGWVKWDGCINWQTHPDTYAHLCDLSDAQAMLEGFHMVWVTAAANIPKWGGPDIPPRA